MERTGVRESEEIGNFGERGALPDERDRNPTPNLVPDRPE